MTAPEILPDLRQLRVFVALADERHFGRAGERLNMAQPAVSRALRRLEQSVGTQLLTRSSRRVALTPAGAALLPHARTALDAARAGMRAADQTGRPLRVGVDSTTAMLVGPVAEALRPMVLDITTITEGLAGQLRAQQLDVVVTYLPQLPRDWSPGAGLAAVPLVAVPMVAALPPGHRLAGRDSVELHELAADPWVHIPRDRSPDHHDEILHRCATYGFAPRVVARADSVASMLQLVAAGVGVCTTISAAARLDHGAKPVALVPVRGEHNVIGIVHHTGERHPVLVSFVRHAARAAEAFGPG